MSSWTYSASTESNLMKVKYGKLIDKQFLEDSVVFGRLNQMKDFEGSQKEFPVIQSIGGGVGAGSLPTASENKTGKATITSKKLYAVVSVDRESMKAARSDEGSFVRFTAHAVKIGTRSFNRNLERMIVRGDATGTGALITGNASNTTVGGSAGNYIVYFDAASAYDSSALEPFEEGDLVNINSETTALEVTAVSISSSGGGNVTLVGTSSRLETLRTGGGAGPFTSTDKVYMQNSKDSEMIGLKGILSATSSTLYGINVGRRWQAFQKNASSAAVSTDLLNEVCINLKKQCGESPSFLLASYKQYLKILNLLEDQKTYNLPAKSDKYQISYKGVEMMTADGPKPIFASKYVEDDEIYFLNDNHMSLHLRPGGFEWFDEDGTVFLRASTDAYDARYGGYGQFFANPHFQGYLYGLA